MEREKNKSYEYGKKEIKKEEEPVIEKEKPSLALSGNLTKDTNSFNGVVVKYNEPPEARKPNKRWRLYCFKGEQELPFYPIHRQSAYLIGKDRRVADIATDHPSCSKQHAALQYRVVDYKRKDGSTGRTVKPYIIDLGSTNGTFLNNQQIEAERYYELREKDVIKFGFSSREFVLLHEESKNDLENEEFDEVLENDTSLDVKKDKSKPEKITSEDKYRSEILEKKSHSNRSDSDSDDERERKSFKKHKSHK
jgi:smad nuclear-interacting protein 1